MNRRSLGKVLLATARQLQSLGVHILVDSKAVVLITNEVLL